MQQSSTEGKREVVLTPEQEQLVHLSGEHKGIPILLTGAAGSGKTAAMARAALEASKSQRPVIFLSPTHQAKTVLQNALRQEGIKASVGTIASYLKQRRNDSFLPPEDDLFEVEFIGGYVESCTPGTLLFVDECSMVSLKDLRRIRDSNIHGLTIMAFGKEQLMPVRAMWAYDHLMSSVEDGEVRHIHLTINHRSEVPELTRYIEEVRVTGRFPKDTPATAVKVHGDRLQMIESMKQAIDKYGLENVVLLAHTNKVVNAFTTTIRGELGYPDDMPQVGEVLRVDGDYSPLDWHEEYARLKKDPLHGQQEAYREASRLCEATQLHCGDFIRVVSVSDEVVDSVPWSSTEVAFRKVVAHVISGEQEGREFTFNLPPMVDYLSPESPIMTMLRDARNMADYLRDRYIYGEPCPAGENDHTQGAWEYLNSKKKRESTDTTAYIYGAIHYGTQAMFARLSSTLVMTVTKAQGSGRDCVLIAEGDFNYGDPARLRYTAVSRARKEVHLLRSAA